MQIKTVLFDLDGTLLPMDQDVFIKAYFGGIAKRLAPHGYDPQKLIEGIWAGTKAMVKNDGSTTNEEAFWRTFEGLFGARVRNDIPHFDAFYSENFDAARESCGYTSNARKIIDLLHQNGIGTVLATNPIFPAIATEKRMSWVDLSPADFLLYTTYENSRHCKPNPDYYRDIMNTLSLDPTECLMVGNDVGEDMIAEHLGMQVFLLTDCIINKANEDISKYPHGNFDDLTAFLLQACGISDTAHDTN